MESKTLDQVRERYILHWGEMGPQWGVNRTVAQVHALLYIIDRPLDATEIMERLSISRGNVSMAVNELIDWGLVRRVHVLGDRREYYTSDQDAWTLLRKVLEQRKRREVDPTIDVLRAAVSELGQETSEDAVYARRRLQELLELFELGGRAFDSLEDRSPRSILSLVQSLIKGTRGG